MLYYHCIFIKVCIYSHNIYCITTTTVVPPPLPPLPPPRKAETTLVIPSTAIIAATLAAAPEANSPNISNSTSWAKKLRTFFGACMDLLSNEL